ncbi:Uncharacterised protein [Orientia tsutsugamushi]|uniref:Uncharacterized protein n=2 Tax=Orientia tsutsugamushi TaxID=784 RepID=A0A0F3PB15_ORITS|nr:hypothetical protein OTSTA716_0147 [Orientia tsutsugamushi str. TA716]SPM45924.1 Uncharacterised protein [Orientia tsutsugamushi]
MLSDKENLNKNKITQHEKMYYNSIPCMMKISEIAIK